MRKSRGFPPAGCGTSDGALQKKAWGWMQGLTWAARTHSIMVFIWHKLPKWSFSLAYINKTIISESITFHQQPSAKFRLLCCFRLVQEQLILPRPHPQGLMNLWPQWSACRNSLFVVNEHKTFSEGLSLCCRLKDRGYPVK